MKLISLVENTTNKNLETVHGLAIYIETKKHKILFDLGPDKTLFNNAKSLGIDLSLVDTVVISHGHYDHGGALEKFLEINKTAKVFVQEEAFTPHFSNNFSRKIPIGINLTLKSHPQIVLVNGDYKIDEEMSLFVVNEINRCYSPANDALFDQNGKDVFSHEQNLILHQEQNLLVLGCGHTGIVNIMEKAKIFNPKICVGGYHLYNPTTMQSVKTSLLDEIANALSFYDNVKFYTCHCTGKDAFVYLSHKMNDLHYLSCGDEILL